MDQFNNYIGGEWTPPRSGKYLDTDNPATGQVDAHVADSDAKDIDAAVAAARDAFPAWSRTGVEERARILFRIADEIDARKEDLARAESRDQGKPVDLALKMDIARAAHNFRYFAGHVLHRFEQATMMDTGAVNITLRKPVGVTGLISPWNLPLYLLTWKIAPALACGNTAVAKPSEFTSRTAFMLTEIFKDVGLPAGVCNIVFGLGAKAGQALVEHSDVPLISFTGGTVTGRKIAETAAPSFKKLSLELGGKNANIVFADSDLDRAVKGSIRASFLNQGEICLCGSRLFVEKSIFESFLEKFVSETKRLKVGDPQERGTFMGPLVSKPHYEKVKGYLDLARSEGVEFLAGGGVPQDLPAALKNGYFLGPTVLKGVPVGSRLEQEEIFGPVVTVHTFDTEDEAVTAANGVEYGLSASVWTRDLARAHRVGAALDAGTVWVNTWMMRDLRMPFGGVKKSGMGREGADHSVDFFTEVKTLCLKTD